jgi:hypothetical protein
MTGTAADVRHDHEAEMTAERALALSECRAEGLCFPRCPHCAASPAEVVAARAWLDDHPDEEAAWTIGQLARIASVLRHWTVEPTEAAGHWTVVDEDAVVAGELSRERADAIVKQHNQQVSAALGILDWYLDGE